MPLIYVYSALIEKERLCCHCNFRQEEARSSLYVKALLADSVTTSISFFVKGFLQPAMYGFPSSSTNYEQKIKHLQKQEKTPFSISL